MDIIRIALADDHKLIRQGIKDFLETRDEYKVVGEAEDGKAAVIMVNEIKPDVVLMDLNMPKMDGIEAIRNIKSANPNIKIIVLTAFTQNDKVFQAIDAGADGYQLKDILPDELVSAIKTVVSGKPSMHPEIVQKLILGISSRNEQESKLDSLSTRELEVLQLIAEGKSNDEIAQELIISVLTVKTHVHNILSKLDMTKRVQVALFAKNQPEVYDREYKIEDIKNIKKGRLGISGTDARYN
jgi:DNA-binding NarL/FixJ family response regulator